MVRIDRIDRSNVFIEIGQAIGNIGGKALKRLRRQSQADMIDRAYREHRAALQIEFPAEPEPYCRPGDDDAIDVDYRVLEDKEV